MLWMQDAGAEIGFARGDGAAPHGAKRLRTAALAAWQACLALTLFAAAMTSGITYDEDQHIAAGVLARDSRLYADFVYLQPPLYPLLLSAVFGSDGGYHFLAARLLTWALSIASCAILFGLCLRLGAGRFLSAALVTACVASPFLAGPLANTRNDVLPLCLFLTGLACYLRAGADGDGGPAAPLRAAVPPRALFAAAGLFVGLALAAKLSYAFGPAVIAGHTLAGRWRGARRSRAWPVALGIGVASLPGLYHLAAAPEGFLYGQLEYHLTAPIAWYTQQAQSELLGADERFALLGVMLVAGGNGTLALLASLAAVARRAGAAARAGPAAPASGHPAEGLLLALLAGALVCGFLPNPSWPMYYAPVAPLLACWVASQHHRLRAWAWPRPALRSAALAAALVPTAFGLSSPLAALAKLPEFEAWPGLAVHRNALAIREAVERAGWAAAEGGVATLFPVHVLDANPIRAEFASGPFFFRTAPGMPPERIDRLRGAGPDDLDRRFAAGSMPAAIFAGVYAELWRAPMDAALVAFAERHGYVLALEGLSAGGATGGRLYVRPPKMAPRAGQAMADPALQP